MKPFLCLECIKWANAKSSRVPGLEERALPRQVERTWRPRGASSPRFQKKCFPKSLTFTNLGSKLPHREESEGVGWHERPPNLDRASRVERAAGGGKEEI